MSDKPAYVTKVIDPIAEALPAHTHISEPNGRTWKASWTNTDGLWTVMVKNPMYDPVNVEIAGPDTTMRLEWPEADLVLHVLRTQGAFQLTEEETNQP